MQGLVLIMIAFWLLRFLRAARTCVSLRARSRGLFNLALVWLGEAGAGILAGAAGLVERFIAVVCGVVNVPTDKTNDGHNNDYQQRFDGSEAALVFMSRRHNVSFCFC